MESNQTNRSIKAFFNAEITEIKQDSVQLKDKNGILLIDKYKDNQKNKVMKLKIDEFKKKGFNNIVLSGHSAGAKSSFVLKSNYPKLINGVISFHVGFGGKFAKAKNPEKKRKEIEEKLAKSQSPFPRAEAFSVHEIIDPKDTRQYLCSWITRVQKSLEVKLLDK